MQKHKKQKQRTIPYHSLLLPMLLPKVKKLLDPSLSSSVNHTRKLVLLLMNHILLFDLNLYYLALSPILCNQICFIWLYLQDDIKNIWGLPWWRSGWESACQCRGHGFDPWSGKIPHAAEQLGPWATTTEPARLEPVPRNKRGRDGERSAHGDEEWPPLATTRESPRTETKYQHSQNK